MPRGRPFRVGSNLDLQSLDIAAIRAGTADHRLLQRYSGNAFIGIGGQFTLDEVPGTILTSALPPVLHVQDEKAKSLLRWALERLAEELAEESPGGSLLVQQLSSVLLIQALRLHLETATQHGPGWFYALADPQVRATLSAMHSNPEKRWTLDALARLAGLSRTGFAVRFKHLVGRPPLDHLARWRVLVAMERLRTTLDSLSTIAVAVGYESQSSFSTAFRRVAKMSPAQYRRQHRTVSDR